MNVEPDMTASVEHDVIGQRFRLLVDGRRVGFADYVVKDHVRVFNHTVVNPEDQGNGFAGAIIKAALDDSRNLGLHVVPACSFVRHFIAKNPEYASLIAREN
ncbi:N-acetyltransferase [Hoyosella sp. YIM 151337]|uniref:GNAT family N-acetyltransferase n=1 Tax=Hoyosella sp. YIM 151337 TaxID=2992742 RepID=UPI002236A8FD|nr:GNAT family N-acetyltransferase [Hoyosella sp. YIM 151337]MCW4353500.1 N-acetyltransferase [Hoyosella sp. YIM 151337]